ncbi:hypothetical protein J8273_5369 [Carpediemonas membranifera]|uniref:Uncharacterized protein n=1 Tax=Carpediemonas membranifera TaxID=201153 RepID=A0A8J6DYK2_9EUKA|nr:hypothetical protein J8273_5369 [Carpediemonas membranifera]|eukprot:KAG9392379.1 hypothetical protein J8273_5369 [Carpediemonas membranifera]
MRSGDRHWESPRFPVGSDAIFCYKKKMLSEEELAAIRSPDMQIRVAKLRSSGFDDQRIASILKLTPKEKFALLKPQKAVRKHDEAMEYAKHTHKNRYGVPIPPMNPSSQEEESILLMDPSSPIIQQLETIEPGDSFELFDAVRDLMKNGSESSVSSLRSSTGDGDRSKRARRPHALPLAPERKARRNSISVSHQESPSRHLAPQSRARAHSVSARPETTSQLAREAEKATRVKAEPETSSARPRSALKKVAKKFSAFVDMSLGIGI